MFKICFVLVSWGVKLKLWGRAVWDAGICDELGLAAADCFTGVV